MSAFTRRDFLVGASAAVAGASFLGRFAAAEPAKAAPVCIKAGTDLMTLGRSGIKSSVVGLGTGTVGGREQREMGVEGFGRLVREAFDRGITYIDTADMYKMHSTVATAIKELPRDRVFVQTKTTAKTADAARADLERFRRELNIETLDTVLMHCMTQRNWPNDLRPVLDALLDAKHKGQVRAVGVSCHTLEALQDAVACDDLDVHLVRINHAGEKMDAAPEAVAAEIRKMHAKGHGIIGMKIYGEGAFKTREERAASIKYVLGLGCVQAFTIGFSSMKQIEETLDLIHEAAA